MKKALKYLLSILFLFSTTTQLVFAAPPEDEVQQLLAGMNWTMEELQDYLAFYELTLEDFDTVEELQWMLGTPITDENLNELLQNHGLTKQELEVLLGEFGESLSDYHFIEDLDVALDFYTNNEEYMLEIEDFLANIGLSDEEVERVFTHLLSIDETVLEEEMERITTRLEPFMTVEDPAQLSEQQQQELFTVWEDMLTAFHLKANFYLVNGTKTAISYNDLTSLDALNGNNVLVELYDLQGNLLLDMQLSNEMLTSDFIFDAGEEFIHVGELAGELTNELHDAKLPDTASPYGLNIIFGIFLIIAGVAFYRFSRTVQRA